MLQPELTADLQQNAAINRVRNLPLLHQPFSIAQAHERLRVIALIGSQAAGMGLQDYRAQHEPILYGWKPGDGKHFFCGDRTKTTVWQIGRDAQASYVHPTQKPVALPEEAIRNSSKRGAVCLDLFGGSGSTLIACEKTGRVNRSMELDPKFCDVIVRRWQDFTGARAVHAVTGQPFPQA